MKITALVQSINAAKEFNILARRFIRDHDIDPNSDKDFRAFPIIQRRITKKRIALRKALDDLGRNST